MSSQNSRLRESSAESAWRTYATVSTVRSPPLLGSLVDLDALDDQVARVETLGVGVRLGVLEQAEQEGSRLDGPPSA